MKNCLIDSNSPSNSVSPLLATRENQKNAEVQTPATAIQHVDSNPNGLKSLTQLKKQVKLSEDYNNEKQQKLSDDLCNVFLIDPSVEAVDYLKTNHSP